MSHTLKDDLVLSLCGHVMRAGEYDASLFIEDRCGTLIKCPHEECSVTSPMDDSLRVTAKRKHHEEMKDILVKWHDHIYTNLKGFINLGYADRDECKETERVVEALAYAIEYLTKGE